MDTLIRPDATRLRIPAGRAVSGTPRRLLLAGIALAGLVVVFVLVLSAGVSTARGEISGMSAKTAEVSATNDLYFRVNDMDAQAANALLVGFHPTVPVPPAVDATASRNTYEADRLAADADLQRIALNPTLADQYTKLLDALGGYESLIGQALYIDQNTQAEAPAAPPATALAMYQEASSAEHSDVLPIAARIAADDSAQLNDQFASDSSAGTSYVVAVIVLGLLLAAALIATNQYLAARFRRIFAPGLLAGLTVILAAAGAGTGALLHAADRSHVAKQQAFDSINVLTHARAVSYDVNADESRWLLDRTDALQSDFFTKVEQIASVPGVDAAAASANPSAYYDGLGSAVSGLSLDAGANTVSNVKFGGFLGAELNNITFPGEATGADTTAGAFNAYLQDDAAIRADANRGDVAAAVALDIGSRKGQSNYDYYQYDQALQGVIAINQNAFRVAIADGQTGLDAWTWLPYAAGIVLLGLLGAALYPRLREYR